MRDDNGLTIKQRKFADAIIAGLPGPEAIDHAGYDVQDQHTKHVMTCNLVNHPRVRDYVLASLDKFNLGPDTVSTVLSDASKATNNLGQADHNIRLQAAKELNKMIGSYAPSESRQLRLTASYTGSNRSELEYIRKHGRKPRPGELASKQDE